MPIDVPPQQLDWWREEVTRQMEESGTGLKKLSMEMKDKVFENVEDFPISMDEAKEVRLKLMDERREYGVQYNESFVQNVFSLCEH